MNYRAIHDPIHAANDTNFRFANIYGDYVVIQAKPFSVMICGFVEIKHTVAVYLESKSPALIYVSFPDMDTLHS